MDNSTKHLHSFDDISEPEDARYEVAPCACTRYPCLRICPCGRKSIGVDIVTTFQRFCAETYGPQIALPTTKTDTRGENMDDGIMLDPDDDETEDAIDTLLEPPL